MIDHELRAGPEFRKASSLNGDGIGRKRAALGAPLEHAVLEPPRLDTLREQFPALPITVGDPTADEVLTGFRTGYAGYAFVPRDQAEAAGVFELSAEPIRNPANSVEVVGTLYGVVAMISIPAAF